MDLRERVAIVTGGGQGIGRALCRVLAEAGARVVVVDAQAAAAQETCGLLASLGPAGLAVEADVSDTAQVQAYVQSALQAFGRIDILVNNAGIAGAQRPLVDYPEDVFERVLRVNLTGTFLGMKHVLPVMIAQGKGAIVNMASVAGTVGAPTMAAYSASKHGVIGLTRTAAGEVARQGIRVNAICPGPIDTAMIEGLHAGINPQDPASVKAFNVGRNPMGRYGDPLEVARLACFLASDAASYVNGVAWLVDGGRTAI